MNQEYKIKILTLLVIALSLLSISMIVTVLIKKTEHNIDGGRIVDTPIVDYKGHFFTFYLQFDSTQIEQFKVVNEMYLQEKKEYSKIIGQHTMNLATHINGKGDRAGELPFYSSIIDNHKKLKHANYNYYISVRNICNNEQKVMLDEFFSSILCIDNSLCGFLQYDSTGTPIGINNLEN